MENVKQKLKIFYLQKSYGLVKSQNRSYKLCVFLISIRYLFYIYVFFSYEIENLSSNQLLLIKNIWQNISYIITAINSFCLLLLMVNVISDRFYNESKIVLSYLFQIYIYATFPMSTISSNQTYQQYSYISLYNIVSTILLSLFVVVHDYDLRFIRLDYLQSRTPKYKIYLSILDYFLIGLWYVIFDEVQIFRILVIVIMFLRYLIEMKAKNILCQKIKFVELAYLHTISIAFIVQLINFNIYYTYADKYALFILLIPLNLKLTQIALKHHSTGILSQLPQTFNNNQNIQSNNERKDDLDYILRLIYNFSKTNYDEYINNPTSIQESYIKYIHKVNCLMQDGECFCQAKLDPLDTFQEKNLQKQLVELISSYYRNNSCNPQEDSLNYFGLLYFLIDICQNIQLSTILAYEQITKYISSQNKISRESLFDQQIYYFYTFNYLPQQQQQYYLINLTKVSQNNQSQNQEDEQIINLDIYEKEYQQQQDQTQKLQLIQAILYEENEMQVCQDILKCLINKNELLNFLLYHQKIVLTQLQKKLNFVKSNLKLVKNEVKNLINLNPFNILLPQIVDIIENEFCSDRKLFNYLKQVKKIFYKKDHQDLRIRQYIKQTIELTTLTDSCILFLSLIEKNPFIVKKATQNYVDFFNWNSIKSPLIGQSINVLMPPVIARYHDQVIRKYYFKSQNYNEVIKTLDVIDSRQQIAIDGQGWAVSYSIQYQLTVLSDTEIGICSRIEKQKGCTDCLIADAETFEIIAISENLQMKLIEEYQSSSFLRNVKINKIISELEQFLNILDKNNLEQGQLEAVLTKPSFSSPTKREGLNKTKKQYDIIGSANEELVKYYLKADCIYKKSSFKRLIQLKVISLKLISTIQDSQSIVKKRQSNSKDERKVYLNQPLTTENSLINQLTLSAVRQISSPLSKLGQTEAQDEDFQIPILSYQDTFINTERVLSNNNLVKKQNDNLKILQRFDLADVEDKHKISEMDEDQKNPQFNYSETRSRQTEQTYSKQIEFKNILRILILFKLRFKIMARNIHSNNQILGLKLINIFGYAFFIMIIVLSVVNYYFLNSAYLSQQSEVLNLDWPQQVQNSLQQEVVDLYFQKLTQDQYYVSNLFQQNEQQSLAPRLQAQMKNQLKLLKNYIEKHLQIKYPTQDVEEKILSQKINYKFKSKINQNIMIDSTSIYRIEHVVYFMLQSVFTISTFKQQLIQTNEALVIDNFENLQKSYTDISLFMEDAIQLKFQQLQSNSEITFYTIFSFAIIFFIFFAAIYGYIQNKRNKILKGVSLFQPACLVNMIGQNQLRQTTVEEMLDLTKVSNEFSKFKKQIDALKSNQISQLKEQFEINQKKNVRRSKEIKNLKTFSIFLSLIGIFNLALIQLYSFSNFIMVKSFLQLLSEERQFLDVMSSVQVMMNRSAGYTPQLLLLKIYYPDEFQHYYKIYIDEIQKNIQLNQKHYNTYLNQQYVNRNNQTLFMYYFDGLYKGDACNMTKQFSSYVTGGGFNITDCNLVTQQIFSQGIIQGITFFYEHLKQQFDVLAIQDIPKFIYLEQDFVKSFTFFQQNQFRINLQQIFSASKKFVRYQIMGDYESIISRNQFYFRLQMALSCTIFIFIWITFYTYLRNLYHVTKQALDVFDLHSLANNQRLYQQFYKIK